MTLSQEQRLQKILEVEQKLSECPDYKKTVSILELIASDFNGKDRAKIVSVVELLSKIPENKQKIKLENQLKELNEKYNQIEASRSEKVRKECAVSREKHEAHQAELNEKIKVWEDQAQREKELRNKRHTEYINDLCRRNRGDYTEEEKERMQKYDKEFCYKPSKSA